MHRLTPFDVDTLDQTTFARMADVVEALDKFSTYKDSQASSDRQSQLLLLKKSATLYVGNLSFYTTEEQIYELFSKCTTPEEGGGIKRIIMGLDRNTRQALSMGTVRVTYFFYP